jgi:hypothetical protein
VAVAAVGPKKRKSKTGSGWSWRLAGIALCAFFALGVITGLSESGRVLARRIEALVRHFPHSNRAALIPAVYETLFADDRPADVVDDGPGASRGRPANGAIALIERSDGFFQIDSSGRLLGPVSPIDAVNLPILSGGGVQHAPPAQLIEYATRLIRAEAALSAIISQMRIGSDGQMRLFLDRVHLVIDLTPGQLPLQLARAAKVLAAWRNRREPIAMIDMTIPDEAIVRPPVTERQQSDRAKPTGSVSRPG